MPYLKKIVQIVSSFNQHDAVGNEIVEMDLLLKELGVESAIFHYVNGVQGISLGAESLKSFDPDKTLVIHHYAVASGIQNFLINNGFNRIWLRYHNVTPPVFFEKVDDRSSYAATKMAIEQLPEVCARSEKLLAVSDYNAEHIRNYFDKNFAVILPIVRRYEKLQDYSTTPISNEKNIAARKKILFVGRVCPNKAQHDLIEALYLYKKVFSPEVSPQLIIAGSFYSEQYTSLIIKFAQSLGFSTAKGYQDAADEDVIFTGSISEKELVALYKGADLFLCLSEHEGFGVPLVEAMVFGVPIVAHAQSAVPETLGGSGRLVNKLETENLLVAIRDSLGLKADAKAYESLKDSYRTRLEELGFEKQRERFRELISAEKLLQ